MDIKNTGTVIPSTATSSPAKPSGQAHNQTSQQPSNIESKQAAITQFKLGQQIELLVSKITDNKALLSIIGSDIQMHTTDKALLQIGQRLQAKIIQIQPQVQLSILNKQSISDSKTTSLINSTLRQNLPQQQSLKKLLDSIQLLTQVNATKEPQLHAIKNNFIQSLPPSQAFESADVLPQIFKRSGIFTENVLAHMVSTSTKQNNFPNNDLKIALLRLATQLKSLHYTSTDGKDNANSKNSTQAPQINIYSPASILQNQQDVGRKLANSIDKQHSDAKPSLATPVSKELLLDKLIHLTEGSLARLHTHQLQQHQLADTQKPAWVFELPIRSDSSLDSTVIYINKDDSNNNDNQYTVPWSLIIKLNIEGLGDIQANIKLQGVKISINFWFDNTMASTLFSEHIHILESKFNNVGLEPTNIKLHNGTPPPITTALTSSSLSETT